jgi:hypothetical protein
MCRFSFMLGMLFAQACYMGFQDYLGLERYMEIVKARWWELPSWVGFGLAGVVFICQLINESAGKKAVENEILRAQSYGWPDRPRGQNSLDSQNRR